MKAARWHKVHDVRIDDVAEPQVSQGKVKIKIAYAGICGSDLHEYLGGPIFIPVGKAHPLTGDKAPVIMGHEFSGQVTEVGAGVKTVKVGDRVVVEPIYACGHCPACRRGHYNLCKDLGFHGLAGGGGGFAEWTVVPENMVHKMPDSLFYEQGALAEPAAVALWAVRSSSLKVGDSAVVFGAGPIGLLIVEALRAAGAARIFVVEPSEQRAQKALELGAHGVVNPMQIKDVVAHLHKLTEGGADFSFEVTGVPAVLTQAIEATHAGGETVIVSIWEKEASLQPNLIVIKEKTVKGVIAYRNVFPAVLELMEQGYFPAKKLVTKRIKLADIVAEGFEALVKDKHHVKILVQPIS